MTTKTEHLRIVGLFAHPDDEGFGSGGTLAMLARHGHSITIVCATNGDVGEISDPDLATPETLGSVRKSELRCAMDVTGIHDIRFLDYRDSGMEGSEDNKHPNALINSQPDMVINQITTILSSINPDVILTHDPTGGYGHPDHKTISSYTRKAYLEMVRRENSTKRALYYVCFPKSDFQRVWETLYELGIKPPFASENLNDLGTPDEEVTTIVDVGNYVDTKIASLNCHRTQIDPNGPFEQLPKTMLRDIMSTEHYQLVYPDCYRIDDDILRNFSKP